ncbi:MAG TPA: CocE/NonD family hydrolase, partial [Candidatus Thermoplasmatota archaeon]|nr:CocE/NonD family hydrolase [Candidatus Thermoplasmatota archaeon]
MAPRPALLPVLLVAVLLAGAFAGCLGGGDPGPKTKARREIPIGAVPASAKVERVGTDVHLVWPDVALPFRETVSVPAEATLIRLVTVGPAGVAVRSNMVDADTGRRRCNTDSVNAWGYGITGTHICSGTALIDPPGAKWNLIASGPAGSKATVRLEFSSAPLDGLAGKLNLGELSMPTFVVTPTKGELVPSFDGQRMWVEVTLPEGPGPWPTVMAASPYNGQSRRINAPGGTPAMWTYFTHDWARRGYAIVNVDVRGFGLSEGCVEIWGKNEQRDQAFMVDWVAKQPWSDGRVGFYGQSYVGTTPVEAAVQAPEALKAIIAVAPVINAYEDWHFGGVPNGENLGSPVAYQGVTDPPGQGATPEAIVRNKAKGVCEPTVFARANDPRAVYDDFYKERNFKLRAKDVKAAVLFTEGFEDSNVKSSMIPGWFNELPGPKLGIFGHWVHQHPTRADEELLFLGWMDHYVKGRDLGFDTIPPVEVVTNVDTIRQAQLWPDPAAPIRELWPDFPAGKLHSEKPASLPQVQLLVTPVGEQQA